jgi:hypothetical protein
MGMANGPTEEVVSHLQNSKFVISFAHEPCCGLLFETDAALFSNVKIKKMWLHCNFFSNSRHQRVAFSSCPMDINERRGGVG